MAAWPPFCSMMALVCSAGVAEKPSPPSEAPTSLMTIFAPASKLQTWKLSPQPQRPFSFGLTKTKPALIGFTS